MTVELQSPDSQLHLVGNRDLLLTYKVAFLCSRLVPPSLLPRARQWAEEVRRQGTCVISGFHSPAEKQVLELLLVGSQPVIVALACGIQPAVVRRLEAHLAASRLLLLSRYAPSVTHPCQEKSYQRNRLMLELADEVVVGYAAPGGALGALLEESAGSKPLRHLLAGAGGG